MPIDPTRRRPRQGDGRLRRVTRTGEVARTGALATALAVVLGACAADAPQDTLEPAGPFARQIMDLFTPVFWVATVIFFVVEGALLFAIFRYRRRPGEEDRVPEQVHGNTRLEIGWTIVPAAILAVIAVFTVSTIFDLAERPDEAVTVEVYGQQWWWEYRYPDADVTTANELVIPADTPVFLELRSRDVIHSFWVPKLNGKKDVVPGRTHALTIQADEPGRYLGQCAEFCGLSHANMALVVEALPPDEFEQWVRDQQEPATAPPEGTLPAEGLTLFEQRCATCHRVRGITEALAVDDALVAGAAPDLTHFASRATFAGSIFELDRAQLEAWLRDPPAQKAMAPDDGRGMPDYGLTEEQIDALATFLLELE